MVIVRIVNTLTMTHLIPMPRIVIESIFAWFDTIAFVLAGWYVAPNKKNIAATVLAAMYMALNIYLIAHTYKTEPKDFWTRILAGAMGITSCTVIIAAVAKDGYDDKKKESESDKDSNRMATIYSSLSEKDRNNN